MKWRRLALICYGLADVVKASPELGIKILHTLADGCMDEHNALALETFEPFVPPAPPRPRRKRARK